jgi:hypothetical protein
MGLKKRYFAGGKNRLKSTSGKNVGQVTGNNI